MASAQGILWDRQTLAALTLGTPNWRTEPSAVALPALPPAAPEPHEPTVEAVCSTLRWLRDWRHRIHQEWLVSGKPARLKSQMEALDRKANETAELLWQLWQDQEKPKWKQAS